LALANSRRTSARPPSARPGARRSRPSCHPPWSGWLKLTPGSRAAGQQGLAGETAAQTFAVGEQVQCHGYVGPIIRTQPRPGWDVPFYIVRHKDAGTAGELKCLPADMRKVGAAEAQAATTDLCRAGARLEGRWGISWYEVTVLAPTDAAGRCKVRFDGFGQLWDNPISSSDLRPRGSGPVVRPHNPVADTPAQRTPTSVADGTYQCHKISPGGQLMSVGTLSVRGGKGSLAGMPAGRTIGSIAPLPRDSRGSLVVALDYRSANGFNDRLDCVAP